MKLIDALGGIVLAVVGVALFPVGGGHLIVAGAVLWAAAGIIESVQRGPS